MLALLAATSTIPAGVVVLTVGIICFTVIVVTLIIAAVMQGRNR